MGMCSCVLERSGGYIERTAGTISDTSSQSLDILLKTNRRLIYTFYSITAVEGTNAPTRIELYLVRNGREYLLRSATPGAAGRDVQHLADVHAVPRDIIRAKFIGGTSADAIQLTVSGMTQELPEGASGVR